MMWRKLDFNHHRQPHAPPEDGEAANACQARVKSLFYVHKTKNTLITKQQ
jgi:hypothetical protein